MRTITTDYEVLDDREIDVEIDYRCLFEDDVVYAPMTVSASIYQGLTLFDLIKEYKEHYEKDYQHVGIMEVRIDI